MKLYDSVIQKALSLVDNGHTKSLPIIPRPKTASEKVFIFPEDAAVELGASCCASTYLIAYTSDNALAKEDEILLIGRDISELKGDVPFARIAIVCIDESDVKSDQEFYRVLRNIEYKRYKVNPDGYMVRVNTNQIREGGRVSKGAVDAGISFAGIGSAFLQAYKQDTHVKAVKQVFITDPDFDFTTLCALSKLNEGITVTLDHILKNLKMDCNTCNFKDICDEIEGMRDIHKREEYRI